MGTTIATFEQPGRAGSPASGQRGQGRDARDDLTQIVWGKLIGHKHGIARHGRELPEIRNWRWGEGA